jgi:hypothetical protein
MAENPTTRKQRDHCFAEEAIDEDDHITMWALGGFVPDDPEEAAEFFKRSPPFKHRRPGPENEYRLNLVDKLNKFLDAMEANGCNVRRACKISSANRGLVDDMRQRVPSFAKLWDQVFEGVTDDLESAGIKRAVDGIDEPVYYRGVVVGTKKSYSDSILTMMLAGRRSGVYKTKTATELSGPNGGPLESVTLAAEEFRQIARDIASEV